MKRSTVKKLAAVATPKITAEEWAQAMYLQKDRELCTLKLNVSPEAQAVVAANAALEAFGESLAKKYGVQAPFLINEDGTLTSKK